MSLAEKNPDISLVPSSFLFDPHNICKVTYSCLDKEIKIWKIKV